MSNPVWGMLAKSQSDNETIEQAIARLILAHEADEEAHLGVGESLQSHKASEIIDHLASSIVADKIGNREVLDEHLANDKFYYACSFESIDGWYKPIYPVVGSVDQRPGSIMLYPGAAVGNEFILLFESNYTNCKYSKNPEFQCDIFMKGDHTLYDFGVTQGAWKVAGIVDGFGFVFRGADQKMHTLYRGSGAAVETEIAGYDVHVSNTVRAVMSDNGNNIKFYVNDILVQTVADAGCDFDLPYFISFDQVRIALGSIGDGPSARNAIVIQDR
jgi:hypothetical protein